MPFPKYPIVFPNQSKFILDEFAEVIAKLESNNVILELPKITHSRTVESYFRTQMLKNSESSKKFLKILRFINLSI